ncbi:DUF536 domain-containing protein [Aeoliella mucimassa]|uniref:Uncharacterized protein n=1 Tax=Aeoliella mucimassa TaxID=2527972 RepID=A0A518AWD8_9BACT|nr:DUF536 domain-containing protein [Aeoliella mucimassa]QDU59049.1 hypothetical protein Pan181_52900 [Aeoliella mucimassa]
MNADVGQSACAASRRRASLALVGLLAVALVGCRNNPTQQDAYIRELRMQEDQIYELQDNMEQYQQLLREQRQENAKLREQIDKGAPADSDASDDPDEDSDEGERSLLDRPLPRVKRSEPIDEPELPEIMLGDPVDLGDPEPMRESLDELEPMDGPDPGAAPDFDVPDFLEEPDPLPLEEPGDLSKVPFHSATRLVSNQKPGATMLSMPEQPATSCAMYAEQLPTEPGADVATTGRGVMAIIEPLTSDGAAGLFSGTASLMLVDPEASDEEWEIARWNFSASEVQAAWRDDSHRVLDLPIAVPAKAPMGRLLELWVRLQPDDGSSKMLCSTGLTLVEKVTAQNEQPGERVTTDWAAASGLDMPANNATPARPSRWTASAEPMPKPVAPRTAPTIQREEIATHREAAPEWSPIRK